MIRYSEARREERPIVAILFALLGAAGLTCAAATVTAGLIVVA